MPGPFHGQSRVWGFGGGGGDGACPPEHRCAVIPLLLTLTLSFLHFPCPESPPFLIGAGLLLLPLAQGCFQELEENQDKQRFQSGSSSRDDGSLFHHPTPLDCCRLLNLASCLVPCTEVCPSVIGAHTAVNFNSLFWRGFLAGGLSAAVRAEAAAVIAVPAPIQDPYRDLCLDPPRPLFPLLLLAPENPGESLPSHTWGLEGELAGLHWQVMGNPHPPVLRI